MEREESREPVPPQSPPASEQRPYEPPRIESVRLSDEAAEALT